MRWSQEGKCLCLLNQIYWAQKHWWVTGVLSKSGHHAADGKF